MEFIKWFIQEIRFRNKQKVKKYKETHQKGFIDLVNMPEDLKNNNIINGDLGVQIAPDGRIWVCINGIAFIRFSPHPDGKMKKN